MPVNVDMVERIKRHLQRNGPSQTDLAGLLTSWSVDVSDREARRALTDRFAAAGISVQPPLEEVSDPDALVELRLGDVEALKRARPAPPPPRPEPSGDPEPRRPPAPEPEPERPTARSEREPRQESTPATAAAPSTRRERPSEPYVADQDRDRSPAPTAPPADPEPQRTSPSEPETEDARTPGALWARGAKVAAKGASGGARVAARGASAAARGGTAARDAIARRAGRGEPEPDGSTAHEAEVERPPKAPEDRNVDLARDLGRTQLPLLGAGAFIVIVSLIMPWYRATRDDDEVADLSNAWQWLDILDIYLFVLGVAAAALVFLIVRGEESIRPWLARAVLLLATLGVLAVAYRIADLPFTEIDGFILEVERRIGPYAALMGTVFVVVGALPSAAGGYAGLPAPPPRSRPADRSPDSDVVPQ